MSLRIQWFTQFYTKDLKLHNGFGLLMPSHPDILVGEKIACVSAGSHYVTVLFRFTITADTQLLRVILALKIFFPSKMIFKNSRSRQPIPNTYLSILLIPLHLKRYYYVPQNRYLKPLSAHTTRWNCPANTTMFVLFHKKKTSRNTTIKNRELKLWNLWSGFGLFSNGLVAQW